MKKLEKVIKIKFETNFAIIMTSLSMGDVIKNSIPLFSNSFAIDLLIPKIIEKLNDIQKIVAKKSMELFILDVVATTTRTSIE
tara:strand:+ start:476 stop:724 length:249 start_codon:yes stop_codon:yes gene_type:complete